MDTAVVGFYTKNGIKIAEFNGRCPRTWILNGYGQAEMVIPYSWLDLNEDVVQFGNLVYIESTNTHIPPWAGMIETPRHWYKEGIRVKMYSGEYILKYRFGERNSHFAGSSGEIFKKLIGFANRQGDTRITPDRVYLGGPDREENIHFESIYDHVVKVVDRAGYYWDVEPSFDSNHRLMFFASMYAQKGEQVGMELCEGRHIELTDNPLIEDGMLVNCVFGYGEGATWSKRPFYEARDEKSIETFGLRQHAHSFSGVTNPSTLKANTIAFLNKYSRPKIVTPVYVINEDNAFDYIQRGNSLYVTLYSVGFAHSSEPIGDRSLVNEKRFGLYGQATVYGFGFDEAVGKMQVITNKNEAASDEGGNIDVSDE